MPSDALERYFLGEPLEVGVEKQLLIDDHIIADRWNVQRVQHAPVKDAKNPILNRDMLHEHYCFSPSVEFDEAAGIFRMWYCDFYPRAYHEGTGGAYMARYAESEDGVHWRKPILGLHEHAGTVKNNIVYTGRKNASRPAVLRNPDSDDLDRRYIMSYVDAGGISLAYSPDGIHWKGEASNPIISGHSDCNNNIVWDPVRKLWLLYGRPPVYAAGQHGWDLAEQRGEQRHFRRRVSVSVSEDLLHWSRPRVTLYPDETEDASDYDYFRVFYYHGVFFGVADLLHLIADSRGLGGDSGLFFSRDGFRWSRLPGRPSWIGCGRPGDFDSQWILEPSPPVRVDDELWFYYGGSNRGLSPLAGTHLMGLARLPVDRFIEQFADKRGGYLLTRELRARGGRLHINACTYSSFPDGVSPGTLGEIRVELVEADDARDAVLGGRPVAGFTMEDCDPLRGDLFDRPVSWKGRSDLSPMEGRRLHLRFYLKEAGVYSFQFRP